MRVRATAASLPAVALAVAAMAVVAALPGRAVAAVGTVPGPAAVRDVCRDGAPSCVDDTIAEMRARFRPLGQGCSHNAAFALTYLRTTETFKFARDRAGFFADPAWVNHEGALFAEYYFAAYDDWAAGRRWRVPGAWLVAFDAGRDRRVSGAGNVLLGMNAHINRDLPYVLAAVGPTAPGGPGRPGASHKPDHDRVNEVLAMVLAPVLAELSARFDPFGLATGLNPADGLALIAGWREQAWRYAERLVAARNPIARAVVAAEIEAASAAQAVLYAGLTAYLPPLSTPAPRDAYCAVHHGDAPPPYPFGSPLPY
jgi:Family of unknown function (DUF5995)